MYWVKSQLWSTYSQTSRFLTNINILKSYASIDQVWITVPQEKCSNHQRGKMVKIRVFIENDWFFDFWPNTWLIGLKHDLKDSSTSFWPNCMTQFISQDQLINSWNSVNWWKSQLMKSQLIHQKSNFDFLIKIEFQKSRFINTFKNMKIYHQKIKKVKIQFEKSNFSRLRNFSKCFRDCRHGDAWNAHAGRREPGAGRRNCHRRYCPFRHIWFHRPRRAYVAGSDYHS